MRILIVGDFNFEIYEKSLAEAFTSLGHEVKDFSISERFQSTNNFYQKIQNQIQFGPNINKINNDLLSISKSNFDFIFLNRPRLIKSITLKKIKKHSKIFIYNNDDPFGDNYSFYFWWRYKTLLKHCDHIFAYRNKNLKDYRNIGLNNISLLRSWYIKKVNFPIKLEKIVDVVFIGHFEDDKRDYLFDFLIRNGVSLEIYGPGWEKSKFYKFFKSKQVVFSSLNIYEYNQKLNESKLAIALFSKLNNDGYTRRCFEIPATKTPMLVFKTLEILSLFNDKEAIFFETKEELLSKIRYYLKNLKQAEKIGINGYERNLNSGNEITDRAKQIIETFYSL